MRDPQRDHERYMANREARIEAQRIYHRDYGSKGLRKPRKPRDPNRRKARDHERYMENREKILAYQKEYRETHREEIRERHKRWRMERTVKKIRQHYQKEL